MANYNKVILVGNLTRDPQLSYTPSGTAVCDFGLATNRRWTDREGNKREETCFIDAQVFARAAETFNQYMSKGQPVLVEGHLRFDQWTTPEGDKRSKHRVWVENFQFLGRGAGAGGWAAEPAAPAQTHPQPESVATPQPSAPPAPEPAPPAGATSEYGDPGPPAGANPEHGDSGPPPPGDNNVPF